MPDTPLKVLIIEDDPETRANLRDLLELDGYDIAAAGTAAEALSRSDWPSISVVLLDWRLPDASGEAMLPRIQELAPEASVVISTGTVGLSGAITALRYGAADYVVKPIDPDGLRASLARIAERQRLLREKRRGEVALRTLVEAAPCAILILRPDGTLLYFSPHAEELTGYRASEVLGVDYVSTFISDPMAGQAVRAELARVLEGRPTRGYETVLGCKDGSARWLVWNAQALPDWEGGPAVLVAGQDVTAMKKAQEQSLQAERLAAIGQMMTGLAHESGNALARSQACLEMLAMECEDRPAALDLIARTQKAQNHLQKLYEEVRSYAAPLKLELDDWTLSSVWRQAWHHLEPQRRGRQVLLREHVAGVDLTCRIDHFRMEQVFRNIFENALAAASDPVEIEVVCAKVPFGRGHGLQVCVRDNGPGLGPEQARRIFEPFYTTKTKGTGLGMAIAQRIVKAHGGEIAVGSSAGRGAEIIITLPRDET